MLKHSTQVPNAIFDVYIKRLKPSEVLVLLVVVRQTLGWLDLQGKRKIRDWISQKQFVTKTGLSARTISRSIDSLIEKRLILATDFAYNPLQTSKQRKGKSRIYYEYLFNKSKDKNILSNVQNLPNTKLTITKKKQGTTKLTDWERFQQIKSRDEYD